jgi:sigma-54 specific flagellar transcriptional regulator A
MHSRTQNQRHIIIGSSASTVALRQLIELLAGSVSTALVTGESGTGKEMVAQSLHNLSPRADMPFVPINCGAIPRDLIESELFGHRKGAFTGAFQDRIGRFELAQGGTLFLDEVGDLPLDLQVKLLRVLQERTVMPVGASREIAIDVRLVAATHKNLEEEVRLGRFREDLYYRLNVLPITTSPLRERQDDVVELLRFYAKKHAQRSEKPIDFSPEMLDALKLYQWPGNVRELSNLVDRLSTLFAGQTVRLDAIPSCMLPQGLAKIQAERLTLAQESVPLSVMWQDTEMMALFNDIEPDVQEDASTHLPASTHKAQPVHSLVEASNDEVNMVEQAIFLAQGIQSLPEEGISLKQHLVDIEKSMIEQALDRTQGNVSKTAKLLQLQRTTLIEKINKYELRSQG